MTYVQFVIIHNKNVWLRKILNDFYARHVSLQRGKTPATNEYHEYDTKQSDGEAPVMLELCRVWSTPSLPLLPGPL